MPLTLITGPANAGKAEVLFGSLRADVERGGAPWLVVPTAADVRYHRRGLARSGPVFGVTTGTFNELAAHLARCAGVTGRTLTAQGRRQLLAALVGSGGLQLPGGRGGTRLLRELGALVAELEALAVTPARLRSALAVWEQSAPTAGLQAEALGAVFAAYCATLERTGFVDRELRTARALAALRNDPSLWGAPPPSVCFYGFDDLTEIELAAIDTLADRVGAHVTVSLTFEAGRAAFAGRADAFDALSPSAAEHIAVAPATAYYATASRGPLGHLERHLFDAGADSAKAAGSAPSRAGAPQPQPPPSPAPALRQSPGAAIGVLEGGGERAELELVGAEILALLDSGLAPAEIAVVHRSPELAAGLLAEVFSGLGIAFTMPRTIRFGQTAVGRGLLSLLRCALLDGDGADLVLWLRTPGVVRHPGLVDQCEQWLGRSGPITAAQAKAWWEARHWPLSAIDRVRDAAARGQDALIERVQTELWLLFTRPRNATAATLDRSEDNEARALTGATAILAELRALGEAVGGAERADAAALGAALVAALEDLRLPAPEPDGADAVAVVDPLQLRARRVRALFLCCLQEGVFPKPASAPPFLSEAQRRGLAQSSGLALRSVGDHLARERYLLYACVSRPEQLLVLSWHTADDDGAPTARSLFVDDICDLFEVSLLDSRRTRALGAVDWPPAPGTTVLTSDGAAVAAPATGSGQPASRCPTPRSATLSDPRVLEAIGCDRPWSASALEGFAACPVRWFVERVLAPDGLQPDGEPLVAGNLIHAVLRDVFAGLPRRAGTAQLTPAALPAAHALLRTAIAEHCSAGSLSADPARDALGRRRMEADLARLLDEKALEESDFAPRHLELPFGFTESRQSGDGPAEGLSGEPAVASDGTEHGGVGAGVDSPVALPTLDLGEGVRIRGRIDRVDVNGLGQAIVYDYKRRGTPDMPGAKWLGANHFQVAVYMRACRDLLGLDTVGGFYQPVRGRDLRARGVCVDDVSAPAMKKDMAPRGDLEELVDGACEQARQAAVAARSGQLIARPGTCPASGLGCMYPAICRHRDGHS